MIIIIEGPDGSGKTTLANQLSKQTGYKVIHRVQPKTDEEKQIMMCEYLQTIRSGKNMIFDRCWYSEMVYGQIMRDDSVISYPQMYELERLLTKNGAMIIYCTDSKPILWSRCLERGEEYITNRETFDKIWEGYKQLFSCPHLVPVVEYRCPILN